MRWMNLYFRLNSSLNRNLHNLMHYSSYDFPFARKCFIFVETFKLFWIWSRFTLTSASLLLVIRLFLDEYRNLRNLQQCHNKNNKNEVSSSETKIIACIMHQIMNISIWAGLLSKIKLHSSQSKLTVRICFKIFSITLVSKN